MFPEKDFSTPRTFTQWFKLPYTRALIVGSFCITLSLLSCSEPEQAPDLEAIEQKKREQKLLKDFREVSKAAAEERKKFKEAVSFVQDEIRQHEEKVNEDVEKLYKSLDSLSDRVRGIGEEVKKRGAQKKSTGASAASPTDATQSKVPAQTETKASKEPPVQELDAPD